MATMIPPPVQAHSRSCDIMSSHPRLRGRPARPICAGVKAPPDSVLRIVYLSLGWLLIALTPIVGALPGPGGIFLFAGGAALLLKNSNWVKRFYARYSRRYPRHGRLADRVLRRRHAPRGRARPESNEPGDGGIVAKARSLVDFFAGRP
jgi:hypothetical protein